MGFPHRSIQTQDRLQRGWSIGSHLGHDSIVNGLGGTKEYSGSSIAHNITPIGGQLGFVHGHDRRPERKGGRRQSRPFPAIVGNQGDLVVLGDSQMLQDPTGRLDLPVKISVRPKVKRLGGSIVSPVQWIVLEDSTRMHLEFVQGFEPSQTAVVQISLLEKGSIASRKLRTGTAAAQAAPSPSPCCGTTKDGSNLRRKAGRYHG